MQTYNPYERHEKNERAPRVRNRAPAPVQITSEQLLREAQERQEPAFKAPQQRVHDMEELREFQGRKRTEFEGRVRYSRDSIRSTSSSTAFHSSLMDNI